MIDIHMHIGKLSIGQRPLTPSYLLKFMDKNGIKKAALLPIENPEETHYYITTEYVLNVCRRHPDRFIPFCNVDPRRGRSDTSTDFFTIIREYQERGCKGFGEVLAGLYVDDARLQKIYQVCGKLAMPVVSHLDGLRCIDQGKLPRYENMIRKFPETIFVGHAQHFWAEISADVRKKDYSGYPKGKIKKEGIIAKLLSNYSNLYADLSAGSGFNAITRDRDYGYQFLERFQDKLLFGTDICRFNQEVPIISYLKNSLKENKISKTAYDKITRKNAEKVFEL